MIFFNFGQDKPVFIHWMKANRLVETEFFLSGVVCCIYMQFDTNGLWTDQRFHKQFQH